MQYASDVVIYKDIQNLNHAAVLHHSLLEVDDNTG